MEYIHHYTEQTGNLTARKVLYKVTASNLLKHAYLFSKNPLIRFRLMRKELKKLYSNGFPKALGYFLLAISFLPQNLSNLIKKIYLKLFRVIS